MEQTNINKLKIACNQFYLNKYMDQPRMNDYEFDTLRTEYESDGKSVKDLVEWESDMQMINDPMEPLSKIQVTDNDLKTSVTNYFSQSYSLISNYKYDGSSIKAYYNNGKLQKILGTPDEEYGIVRTESFYNMFPHNVDPSIKTLQGEVLVDAEYYGELARNAANGLTNSKYKITEVESEAFVRVYRVQFNDDSWSVKRNQDALDSLNPIIKKRTRHTVNGLKEVTDLVFSKALVIKLEDYPVSAIANPEVVENKSVENVKFQVDGVVVYYSDLMMNSDGIQGFKFYYTQFSDVEVEEVIWNQKPNGSYAAVLRITPCELNDKCISKVSAGGVPNLISNKMGRGAKVRVILANMTIPKVIKVLVESEDYQFPKCSCRYQMTEEDIYGSTLKCGRYDSYCVDKLNKWYKQLYWCIASDENYKNLDKISYFKTNFFWFIDQLHIDRWSAEGKINFDVNEDIDKYESLVNNIYNSLIENNVDKFKSELENNFYFTDLNWCNLDINIYSMVETIYRLFRDWDTLDVESYYELPELE